MINNYLTRYSPPGMDLKLEKRFFIWGMILSVSYSILYFFTNYSNAYYELYIYVSGKAILNTNANMPDFRSLIGLSFIGFAIVAIMMVGFIIYRYSYYNQGSKSMYLMKRLPQKSELHKRALVVPFIAMLLCLLTVFILLMIFYAVYMLATPKACLVPNQWQILWRLF